MSVPTVAVLAAAVALAGRAAPAVAQDTGRQPTRLTMSLEKVLPVLNTAVVRVRTPSESQLAAGDATPKAARDGVKLTHLTGIRVSDDLAIVSVPDVDPTPTSYDVNLYDGWLPALVVATDESGLYALLRVSGQREAAPKLAAAPVKPGFVVGAVSVAEADRPHRSLLDIRKAWLEPGEKIDLPPGAAVFDVEGRFAGLTSAVDGGTIIIPGADVLANADELRTKAKPAAAAPR
ncbi:MAG: hypothetical protein ABIT71_22845 [Vicinamibacteraceae bacterium]